MAKYRTLYTERQRRRKGQKMMDVQASAAALYDGGWRSTDREELKAEYQLTDEEATQITEQLKEYEAGA